MGAGASLPAEIDKSTAQSLAGDKFDESAWEAAAKDGVVAKEVFLAAASAHEAVPAPAPASATAPPSSAPALSGSGLIGMGAGTLQHLRMS